ncbi:hypothetical protein D3C75_1192870 [compost metagenome]
MLLIIFGTPCNMVNRTGSAYAKRHTRHRHINYIANVTKRLITYILLIFTDFGESKNFI